MLQSPCHSPGTFCCSCICAPCKTCTQRHEILDVISEQYVCCGGLCPCCCFKEPMDKNCIYLEVCCCPTMALVGNRFLIQSRFLKKNDPCDNCLISMACVCDCIGCLVECFTSRDGLGDCFHHIADCIHCGVVGCMLTQQHVELNKIKMHGSVDFDRNLRAIYAYLPPHQQQMVDKRGFVSQS